MSDFFVARALGQVQAKQDRRSEIPGRLGAYLSEWAALPMLRGLWAMGAVGAGGIALDSSPNAQTLSYSANPQYDCYQDIIPYLDFDGTGDLLSRATEAALAITGTESFVASARRGLTLLAWLWADANTCAPIGKWNTTGNQRSYAIELTAANIWRASVSLDGTAVVSVDSAASTLGAWHLVALRLDPSTSLDIFVDGEWVSNTTGVPASVFPSSADFTIGGLHGGASLLNGRASISALSASYLADARISKLWRWGRAMFGR